MSDKSINFTFLEDHSDISQTYPSDAVIFQQNTVAREVFIVREGLVKQVRTEVNGAETIVGLRSEGALIGAVSLLTEKPHSFAAICVSKCVMLRLPAPAFLRVLQGNSHYARLLCHGLACEIIEQLTRFSELACLPARLRLEYFLRDNIESEELNMIAGRAHLRLPLKECDIAQVISVTPVHLSRLMSHIEKEGVVTRCKSGLMVDFSRLARRAP